MTQDASRIDLSVIIPTFNRPEALSECIESVAAQALPRGSSMEILALNDGGDPRAGDICAGSRESGLALRYVDSEHLGPSGIRNKAVKLSRGRVLLFLNDDVTLQPGHLAVHLARHQARPGHAARGMTVWSDEIADSDFMSWTMRQSFFYYLIDDFENCGYEYWHTCDLSIDRKWLEGEGAILFNEEFPYAGYEDTEWGWRLEQAGCQLAFLPQAVSKHHHIYTPDGLAQRAWRNGVSGAILLDLVPELETRAIGDFLAALPPALPRNPFARLARRAKRFAQETLDSVSPLDRDIRAWSETAARAYVEGFQEEYAKRHGRAYESPSG